MTTSKVYKSIIEAKKILEGINATDYRKREQNQQLVNKAYNILESLEKEIIKEYKQRRSR